MKEEKKNQLPDEKIDQVSGGNIMYPTVHDDDFPPYYTKPYPSKPSRPEPSDE